MGEVETAAEEEAKKKGLSGEQKKRYIGGAFHHAKLRLGSRSYPSEKKEAKPKTEYERFLENKKAAEKEAEAEAKKRNARQKESQEKELAQAYEHEAARRIRRMMDTAEGNARASRTAADRKRFQAEAQRLQDALHHVNQGGHSEYVPYHQFRRDEIHSYSYKYTALEK